jgi:hypothetical protein
MANTLHFSLEVGAGFHTFAEMHVAYSMLC